VGTLCLLLSEWTTNYYILSWCRS